MIAAPGSAQERRDPRPGRGHPAGCCPRGILPPRDAGGAAPSPWRLLGLDVPPGSTEPAPGVSRGRRDAPGGEALAGRVQLRGSPRGRGCPLRAPPCAERPESAAVAGCQPVHQGRAADRPCPAPSPGPHPGPGPCPGSPAGPGAGPAPSGALRWGGSSLP